MRTVQLVESLPHVIELSPTHADQLRILGRSLASDRRWWGDADETEEPASRTVIQCTWESDGHYRVNVRDAVGVVGLGDVQLVVQPKIRMDHFLFLLGSARQLPRTAAQRATVDATEGLFVLLAKWFVEATEQLLRRDLIRDYEPATQDLPFARGRIHPRATAVSILSGRPTLRCTFDRFGEDTPLNRVIRAAALTLLASPRLPDELRRRARRITLRFDGVGELRPRDREAVTDARSRHYEDAYPIALNVLAGSGVAPQFGAQRGWTFLLRTPEAIEEGVREVLREHLEPGVRVRKKGRTLDGTRGRTINPDLVFDEGVAVGDVKYRISTGDVPRSHLNQVTTFATGYGAAKALVVAFGERERGEHVRVGAVDVDAFNWNVSINDPAVAGVALAHRVSSWLSSVAEP